MSSTVTDADRAAQRARTRAAIIAGALPPAGWITNAPIEEVDFATLGNHIAAMKRIFNTSITAGDPRSPHFTLANNVLDMMLASHSGGYCLKINGQPAAVMTISVTAAVVEIDHLVTDATYKGAGALMVEKALSLCPGPSKDHAVTLDAFYLESSEAYAGMGFTLDNRVYRSSGQNPMTLDPAKSAKWVLVKGHWNYAGLPEKRSEDQCCIIS